MDPSPDRDEARLDDVVAGYLRAVDRGEAPSPRSSRRSPAPCTPRTCRGSSTAMDRSCGFKHHHPRGRTAENWRLNIP